METKVNKGESEELKEAFEIVGNILTEMDEASSELHRVCLK